MCVNKIRENWLSLLQEYKSYIHTYIPEATFCQIGCSHEAVMTSTYDYGIIIILFWFGSEMP